MELASLKVVFGMLLKNEDSQMPFSQLSCSFIYLFFHWVESQHSNAQLSRGNGDYFPVRLTSG